MLSLDWSPLDALDALDEAALDVATRASWLVAGMKLSVDIVATCLEELDGEPGLAAAALKLTAGEGSAVTQSPHGPARVSVKLDGAGVVESLRLETLCAEPFARAPDLLTGRALGEAPALLAALDLCPACAEL
jgi:Ni,Fe-hydrogenase III large subunit